MSYASGLPAHKELFLFVARSSTGSRAEQIPFLERSLKLTKKSYEEDYGPLRCSDATSSNAPFPHRGETSNLFASLRDDVEKYDGRLIVVINGWDGLTTDRHSFVKLFSA
ncbi:hypothetical protein N7510_006024 [Penicillium lagena]|uniref:uncharacterized protein n=1 Tax=Penicillium lagena TaxID=94218 RepID=UPI00253FA0F5|nr:uncharacterized protein N7510_006024 [Penicillium lagena]KAJ5612830.1 hypothetical protein N7510_006024 [Penicillium lagena]